MLAHVFWVPCRVSCADCIRCHTIKGDRGGMLAFREIVIEL